MKTIKNLGAVAAIMLVTTLLTGCVKDVGGDGKPLVAQGEGTGMTLQMVFPRATETRATGDGNAINDEAAIRTVDVFIYTQDGAYLSRKTLGPGDFTQITPSGGNYDAYQTITPITTTTGTKNIYVGVNLPTAAASSLENQTLPHAASLVQTISRTAINLTAGLPMFSTEPATSTLVKAAAQNTITANVQRIVAKVTLEESRTIDNTSGVPGTLGTPLQFAINNQNTKFFLQQGAPTEYRDPNWLTTSYVAGDFAAATSSDYVDGAITPKAITDYEALYALENTSQDHTEKTLTRVTVRATFIPAQIVTDYTQGQGTEPTPHANPASTPATFWTVTPSPVIGTVYFDNSAAATAYATDKGATAKMYTGGMCYWNIFLNLGSVGDVVRNDYYKCTITRIVAPGNPDDSLDNPDSPPDMQTSMTVDVNILYWNTPVLADYELVP